MVTGAVGAETAIIEETLQVQTRMPLATFIIASLAMWMPIAYSALASNVGLPGAQEEQHKYLKVFLWVQMGGIGTEKEAETGTGTGVM